MNHLPPRKTEVLQLIAEGYSHRDIAQRLYLSIRTIENHLYQIQHLLGTNNAAHSVGEAYRQGLLTVKTTTKQATN